MRLKAKLLVIKIGGSTLGGQDTSVEDLVSIQKAGQKVVVVHGGGKTISDWMERHSLKPSFVQGQRVTDAPTLSVVVAVLAGLVNKEIVAAINLLGGRALGLSGIDGGLLEARVKDPALGYVGEVVKVNPQPVRAILRAGYIPVIAPLGLSGQDSSILNINADTAASQLAAALGAERLIFLTDVAGVLDGSGQLIGRLSVAEARGLIASGAASGGMMPKLEACLSALGGVGLCRIIDGRQPHALLREMKGSEGGTTIQ